MRTHRLAIQYAEYRIDLRVDGRFNMDVLQELLYPCGEVRAVDDASSIPVMTIIIGNHVGPPQLPGNRYAVIHPNCRPEYRVECFVKLEQGAIIVWNSRHRCRTHYDPRFEILTVEGEEPTATAEWVAWLVLERVSILLERRGCLFFHAAGASDGRHALLVVGPRRAGKTTLLLGLLSCGWQYIANDYSVVGSDGFTPTLEGWPYPINVREGTLSLFPCLIGERHQRLHTDLAQLWNSDARTSFRTSDLLTRLHVQHHGKRTIRAIICPEFNPRTDEPSLERVSVQRATHLLACQTSLGHDAEHPDLWGWQQVLLDETVAKQRQTIERLAASIPCCVLRGGLNLSATIKCLEDFWFSRLASEISSPRRSDLAPKE
jgi:hypothetical protein